MKAFMIRSTFKNGNLETRSSVVEEQYKSRNTDYIKKQSNYCLKLLRKKQTFFTPIQRLKKQIKNLENYARGANALQGNSDSIDKIEVTM